MFFDALSPVVRTVFDSALRDLSRLGMKTADISIPLLDETEESRKSYRLG